MNKTTSPGMRVDYRRQTVTPAAAAKPALPAPAPLPADAIALGVGEYGGHIGLALPKLIEGRLLIQGVSGAGKSWTLRRILEQSARMIQQVIIDPEGEFKSLAEILGHLVVDISRLDLDAVMELAARVRAQRISIVFDVSELDRAGQMRSAAAFLRGLVQVPRDHWTPCVVAIDEAQLFAPFGVQDDVPPAVRKGSIAAVADVMGRGRKRGLVGIIATLRLARLAKSAVSDVHNQLIGKNTLDLDIKRAGEMIGWGVRKASDRLPLLDPGNFVAVGSAFSTSPAVVKIGAVISRHVGATPELQAPAAGVDAAKVLGLDQLIAESDTEDQFDEARVTGGTRGVRMFIRAAGFKHAGLVYDALKSLVPDGTTIDSLRRHIGCAEEELAAAIGLLQSYGVVEIAESAVRIDRNFAQWRL